MKSLITSLLILGTFAVSLEPCSAQPIQQFNGNLFVDGILAALRFAYGEKLNSLDLPERRVKWSGMVGLFNLSGEAKLYQGHLVGFQSIHRTDDAFVSYLDKTKTSVVAKLGAEQLGISYTSKISMWGIGPRLQVSGSVSAMEIDVVLLLDNSTREVKILEFNLINMGKVNLWIDSPMVIGDKIANLMLRATLRVLEPVIKRTASYALRRMLTDTVKSIPLPKSLEKKP